MTEEEREHLTEQANKDIKVLIHEILSQRGDEPIKTYDSEGKEVSPGTGLSTPGAGWVKLSPSQEAGSELAMPGADKGLDHRATEITDHASVKQLLKELREKSELGLEIPETGKVPEPEVVEEVKQPLVKTRPKKKGKVKLKRRVKKGLRKTQHRPEVIKVIEPGVYEIYLSKLLKHFPIIINRDGTYLVHLPSLFESMEEKKK